MSSVTIGIAGGTGGMGRWFEAFFTRAGHQVLIAGRTPELTYADLAHTCDVVAISTPVEAAIDIANEIGPQMTAGQLLMDFCSQKADIVDAMVGAVTAWHYQSLVAFPEFPETDDYGLPMEIVYWLPDAAKKR